MAGGVVSAADSHGIDIEITPVAPGGKPIDTQGADGIILIWDPDVLLAGVDPSFPCVMLPKNTLHPRALDCVMPNIRMIGQLAVEHLLAHGCSALALVTDGPEEDMPRDLIYVFKDAAKHHDVPHYYVGPRMHYASGPGEDLVIDGSAKTLADQLLALPRIPDGLFMGVNPLSDMYDELRSRGIEPVRKDPRSGKSVVVITPETVQLWLHPVKPQPCRIGFDGIVTGERLIEQLLRRIARPDDAITELSIAPRILD